MANKVGAAGGGGGDEEEEEPPPPPIMIEISISCRKLANKDKLSKSDPICIVLHRPNVHQKKWVETFRTELMCNNLNPDFAIKLCMEYRFEQSQPLRFHIFDVDAPTDELPDDDDSMGFADCNVADIVTAGSKGFTKELEALPGSGDDDGAKGSILLIAEEMAELTDEVFLELSGSSVGTWSTCFSCKSFFVISRTNNSGNYLVAHRCAETKGQNPTWPSIFVPGRSLSNGDNDRQLKIEIWRKTLKNEDELVGTCYTTVNRMSSKADHVIMLQAKGKKCKTSITVQKCIITPVYSFMKFIQAGTKIHLCFSIDFTSSNGDPMVPKSLHHVSTNPSITNPYEQAIYATANIIKDYDDTDMFHVYGFGARIPPLGQLSHNFPITMTESAVCHGVDGVIDTYKKCVKTVQLFGPTHLAPTINIIAGMAENSKGGEDYYVLVIICDGVITDVEPTKQAIVKASSLPMSIIIVGVGKAEFDDMEELDGAEEPVSFNGRRAERDIVQFVAYRSAEFWLKTTGEETAPPPKDAMGGIATMLAPIGPPPGAGGKKDDKKKESSNKDAQGKLAEVVLAEIPEQIVGYMKTKDIDPGSVALAVEEKTKAAAKKLEDEKNEK